jgi:hypothetical protein
MNNGLQNLATELELGRPENQRLRLEFGLACCDRIGHLLEDARVAECLAILRGFLSDERSRGELDDATERAGALARAHRGSASIDGSGHAAVSATNAVANALAGRALDAASYAAYAVVYAYGAYAVRDLAAFQEEFAWQSDTLRRLAGATR